MSTDRWRPEAEQIAWAEHEEPEPLMRDILRLIQRVEPQWQPIETFDLDQPVLMWTPKERLHEPDTIRAKPDLCVDDVRVSTRRWWGWATHGMSLPDPPGAVAASPCPSYALACNQPAPDFSGRTCDKPQGHDGDHWTYGGNTLTWIAASPSGEGTVAVKPCMHPVGEWACSLIAGHEGPHEA